MFLTPKISIYFNCIYTHHKEWEKKEIKKEIKKKEKLLFSQNFSFFFYIFFYKPNNQISHREKKKILPLMKHYIFLYVFDKL